MAMNSAEIVSGVADGGGLRVPWTAFNPLGLASGSFDPMGFLRGYRAKHARIVLLHRKRRIRLVAASANLTHAGC